MVSSSAVAIVTGGAGGIGKHVSRLLAERGHLVVVNDRDDDAARETAESLPGVHVKRHLGVGADVTTAEGVDQLLKAAAAAGTITVLVNAVGISPKTEGRQSLAGQIDAAGWDDVMAVNVRAPFLVCRGVLTHMPSDGSASIVNVHSIAGRLGASGGHAATYGPRYAVGAHYAASKAALENLTMSLAREFAPSRIRVNGVTPGFVATEMTAVMPVEDRARAVEQVPMGRFARPSEIADAVAFLVSGQASYITGTSINVTGGWLMP